MKRIALVEDTPDNRLLVVAMIGDTYDIAEYEDGSAALAGMAATVPDVVLLDISLPGMDGTEVLQRMRADSNLSSVPTIALTAHAMAGDREKYLGLGFDGYVSKPIVDDTVLRDAIDAVLGQD